MAQATAVQRKMKVIAAIRFIIEVLLQADPDSVFRRSGSELQHLNLNCRIESAWRQCGCPHRKSVNIYVMFELSKSITLRALAGVAAANPHPEMNLDQRRHDTQTNSTMATEIACIRVPTTRATERRQSRVASRAAKQIESETNRPNSSPMLWHLQSLNIQLSLWRPASIAAGKDRDPRPSE